MVTSDIEYRISTISQQILSRSNLENVIEQFKLFAGACSGRMFRGGEDRPTCGNGSTWR